MKEADQGRVAKVALRDLAFQWLTGVEGESVENVQGNDRIVAPTQKQLDQHRETEMDQLEDEEEFEIESIIVHQSVDLGDHFEREYCVRFKGWSKEHDQWYLESDLAESALEVIVEYENLLMKFPRLCVDLAVSKAQGGKRKINGRVKT